MRRLLPDITPAQLVLVKISIDGVEPADLPQGEREIAVELFGSVDRIAATARTVLLWLLGRASGKSTLAALVALYQGLTVDVSKLAPGEQAMLPIFALDQRQARVVLGFAKGFARARREIKRLVEHETRDGFTLKRGDRSVRIEVLPATPGGGAARGRSIAGAVCDEAAFWDSDDGADASVGDVIDALAPRLMRGAKIVSITSAWAQSGQVHEWTAGQHGRPSTVLVAKGRTETMRDGDEDVAAMVERERARDPDNAAREFDNEFLSREAGLVFAPERVTPCIDEHMALPAPPEPDLPAFCGLDLGFSSDASAMVIVRQRGDVIEVAEIIERKPSKGRPLRPSEVLAVDFLPRIVAHGCRIVATDLHHEQLVREHFARMRVVRLPDGAAGKLRAHTIAQDALSAQRVRMPRHLRLLRQLGEVTAKPTAAGKVTISSPRRRGRHGDIASALVAGLWVAESHGRRGDYQPPDPRRLRTSDAVRALGEELSDHRGSAAARFLGDERSPMTPRAQPGEFTLGPDGRVHRTTRNPNDWRNF